MQYMQRQGKNLCHTLKNYMRSVVGIGILFMILQSSCSKPGIIHKTPIEKTVLGKWTYTENFYSAGGPGAWHAVTPANQTIEFKANGSFIPAPSFLNGANRFEMLDSVTIKFQPATTSSGFILMGYILDTAQRELYLYPVNPMCIEGCSSKFVK
jgi:hypothetical protein